MGSVTNDVLQWLGDIIQGIAYCSGYFVLSRLAKKYSDSYTVKLLFVSVVTALLLLATCVVVERFNKNVDLLPPFDGQKTVTTAIGDGWKHVSCWIERSLGMHNPETCPVCHPQAAPRPDDTDYPPRIAIPSDFPPLARLKVEEVDATTDDLIEARKKMALMQGDKIKVLKDYQDKLKHFGSNLAAFEGGLKRDLDLVEWNRRDYTKDEVEKQIPILEEKIEEYKGRVEQAEDAVSSLQISMDKSKAEIVKLINKRNEVIQKTVESESNFDAEKYIADLKLDETRNAIGTVEELFARANSAVEEETDVVVGEQVENDVKEPNAQMSASEKDSFLESVQKVQKVFESSERVRPKKENTSGDKSLKGKTPEEKTNDFKLS